MTADTRGYREPRNAAQLNNVWDSRASAIGPLCVGLLFSGICVDQICECVCVCVCVCVSVGTGHFLYVALSVYSLRLVIYSFIYLASMTVIRYITDTIFVPFSDFSSLCILCFPLFPCFLCFSIFLSLSACNVQLSTSQ
jgi:hypothetical protein